MTVRTNLRVLVFPADDLALRHEVDRALADVLATVPEPRQIAALTERLQRWYRSIQIRQRETLAGYDDDPMIVWYVYRDGRIRVRNEGLEHLYGAMATARDTYRSTERALDASREAASNAGYRQPAGSGTGVQTARDEDLTKAGRS